MCLLLSLFDISDNHVFITIIGSIFLISVFITITGRYLWYPCVYCYHWVDISDIHVFINITRSISLISMCLLLSLGRYLWYPSFYYYHWVNISDIHVFITITGSISLISICLLLSLGRYLCWWAISSWWYNPPSSQWFGTDIVY
jgi:hypothetical protein